MKLSDASSRNGLIQECEFWTNLGDAAISGDSTLLSIFVNRLNRAYDRVVPLVMSLDDTMRWDDPTHADDPISRTDIVSGQQKYGAIVDEQGNSILNVVKVFVLQSATATDYVELNRVPVGLGRETHILNPVASYTGIPSEYVELGGWLFLGAIPNYNATNGLKIMFERSPSYFSVSTLTQTPGIPEPFHQLLALHASKDYVSVHKPDNRVLIGEIKEEIAKQEGKLEKQNAARHPRRKRITGARRCSE
jgi:hypothetical protein